ncbi:MAG: prenyltransferase/squalene oxidase repeat-containing protein [Planctomycetaceae bacterium]
MSRRLQLLQVARLARRSLGESSDLVRRYLESIEAPCGGYFDRVGRADLYYTSFALDALAAVDASPGGESADRTVSFLRRHGDGEGLDLPHRGCLARAWASFPGRLDPECRGRIVDHINRQRAADGGYATRTGSARGTAYGSFLAVNALADLGVPIAEGSTEAESIVASILSLRSADGGWSNEPDRPEGSTTATASAAAVLASLGRRVPDEAISWLLGRFHPAGGFTAAPETPLPDLLSTAVAVHVLDLAGADWRHLREGVLDFLDTLWTADGGFHGSWADDHPDAEYTYYGLVALGHASV